MKITNGSMLLMTLVLFSACTPIVYEQPHYSSQPGGYYGSNRINNQIHYYEDEYYQTPPIEVTLYAESRYTGVYFQPIQVIIADNQYVEIPVRDRRGRFNKIYAHYHDRNLHFDSDRQHHRLNGASNYRHDKSWNTGREYSNISIGQKHDLNGIRLKIRNTTHTPDLARRAKRFEQHRQPIQKHDTLGYHNRNRSQKESPVVRQRDGNKHHNYSNDKARKNVHKEKIVTVNDARQRIGENNTNREQYQKGSRTVAPKEAARSDNKRSTRIKPSKTVKTKLLKQRAANMTERSLNQKHEHKENVPVYTEQQPVAKKVVKNKRTKKDKNNFKAAKTEKRQKKSERNKKQNRKDNKKKMILDNDKGEAKVAATEDVVLNDRHHERKRPSRAN